MVTIMDAVMQVHKLSMNATITRRGILHILVTTFNITHSIMLIVGRVQLDHILIVTRICQLMAVFIIVLIQMVMTVILRGLGFGYYLAF